MQGEDTVHFGSGLCCMAAVAVTEFHKAELQVGQLHTDRTYNSAGLEVDQVDRSFVLVMAESHPGDTEEERLQSRRLRQRHMKRSVVCSW